MKRPNPLYTLRKLIFSNLFVRLSFLITNRTSLSDCKNYKKPKNKRGNRTALFLDITTYYIDKTLFLLNFLKFIKLHVGENRISANSIEGKYKVKNKIKLL